MKKTDSNNEASAGDPKGKASADSPPLDSPADHTPDEDPSAASTEIGGRPGPDPTRYGDWEKNGRCIDF